MFRKVCVCAGGGMKARMLLWSITRPRGWLYKDSCGCATFPFVD